MQRYVAACPGSYIDVRYFFFTLRANIKSGHGLFVSWNDTKQHSKMKGCFAQRYLLKGLLMLQQNRWFITMLTFDLKRFIIWLTLCDTLFDCKEKNEFQNSFQNSFFTWKAIEFWGKYSDIIWLKICFVTLAYRSWYCFSASSTFHIDYSSFFIYFSSEV